MTIDLESGQNESLDYGGASNGRRRSEGSGVSGEPHDGEQDGLDVGDSDELDGPLGAVGAEEADVHLWLAWDLDERPSESEHVLFGATWGGTVGSDEDGRSLLSHVGDLNP